jgi:alkylation response protein AidB-like acyl-CoA dehydrogenase
MLSNLAAAELDASLHEFSIENGFTYTRYADDIAISAVTRSLPLAIAEIHRSIVRRIRKARFRENEKKTRVAGPGSKKLVLGLLVDGDVPRLSKETYMLEASMAKAMAPAVAFEATSLGMELLGDVGGRGDHLIEKLFRDVKAMDIVEGTGQIQRIVMARHLVQLPRDERAPIAKASP